MKNLLVPIFVALVIMGCEKEKTGIEQLPPHTTIEIGDIHAGGIVVYLAGKEEDLNGDGLSDRGLVASMDVIGEYAWGCYGEDLDISTLLDSTDIIHGPGYEIGDGVGNTVLINRRCAEDEIAAKICAEYIYTNNNGNKYDDWFLPSVSELIAFRDFLPWLNSDGFAFWSSTEDSRSGAQHALAILQGPIVGYPHLVVPIQKDTKLKVLAVRAF